jgi:hypothetical protein
VQQNLGIVKYLMKKRGVDGAKFSAKGGSFDYQDGELEVQYIMYSKRKEVLCCQATSTFRWWYQ